MTPHFITYFDSHYAAQGLAMLTSLRRWCPGCSFTVLCLDDLIGRILQDAFPTGLTLLTCEDLAALEPRLAAIRSARTPWEFFASQKPLLVLHVLENAVAPGEWVAFLDADTFFYSSPVETFAVISAQTSVVISPHRFSPGTEHLSIYGLYNAGFGLWKHDAKGLAVLRDWKAECLDWCYSRVEGERFMNQGYLNRWTSRHDGVVALSHPGFNLAPWNIGSHRLTQTPQGVLVDDQPLVFFHFSSVSRTLEGHWQTFYTYDEMRQPAVLDSIYAPYLDAVEKISARLQREYHIAGVGSLRPVDPATPMLRLRSAPVQPV
ncbi:hypothetical protein [Verrucomicrobium spinosum]|uniref:hypothetical protein n=1 Tax=Verrucomicrobium spinosum TaxID=2736 RepID=UPI0001746309|nr:hypothetical protein [Verrucomicrobium spinosum]